LVWYKSRREIELIREAGKILAQALFSIEEVLKPGITTLYLAEVAEHIIRKYKAYPAFKGYKGFPGAICVSINEEVVHGIPSKRVIKEGDLVSIDLGVLKNGYYSDAAKSYIVGKPPSARAEELLKTTRRALFNGIEAARVGNMISDISRAIQTTVEKRGFGVVRDLVGHGVGRNLHEDPQIPNFVSQNGDRPLKEGMVIAIEPMVTEGDWHVEEADDGWTIVTRDGSLAAHFEHTVAVLPEGPAILTDLR